MSSDVSQQIKFEVKGMTCGGCASKITSTLQRDPRISSAVVDFATHTGVVQGSMIEEDVKKIVQSLGYSYQSQESLQAVGAEIEDHSAASDFNWLIAKWVLSLILVLPVVLLAMGPWHFEWSGLVQGLLTTIFLMGPASGFISRAIKQAIHGYVTMDALVAIGMVSAWSLSWFMLFGGSIHLYFESAAMIGFFVLSGKTLEDWARRKSISEVDKLVRLRPRTGFKISETGTPVELPVSDFKIGDAIYLRPGDMLPMDSVVISGSGGFDESIITGESNPVTRLEGDQVPAGAVNASAVGVTLRVTRVGPDTTIEQLIRMVESARLSRPPIQKLADKVSAVFVPIVMLLAVVTAVVWSVVLGETPSQSIMIGLSVLVVACPCALGLATPVAWVAGVGRAARAGVLVRSYEALENLRSSRVLVFDKTGTLTYGKPRVLRALTEEGFDLVPTDGLDAKNSTKLGILMSALTHSSHPHARALAGWIKPQLDESLVPMSKLLQEVAGQGVEVEITSTPKRHIVRYGKPEFVLASVAEPPMQTTFREGSLVAAAIDGSLAFSFELSDVLKVDAKAALQELLRRKLEIYIASGDRESVVKQLLVGFSIADATKSKADRPGTIKYACEMTPPDKKNLVETLRQSGKTVAFVGDGINDAPALAAADVGIAMGSGSDVAASSAGLVLQTPRLQSLIDALDLSKRITSIIKENFFWAFVYNIAAIPVAMAGVMSPMWASAAMALSSISVVLNALRLRR